MEFIYIIIIISIIGILFWYYKYTHKTVNSPSTPSNTSSSSSSNVNPDANTSSVSSSNTSPASTVSPASNISPASNVSPASSVVKPPPAYIPSTIKTPPLPTPTPTPSSSTTTSTVSPISSSSASTPLSSPASVPPSSSSTAFTPSSSTVLSPMDNPFLANILKKQQALDKTITPTQNYYGIYLNSFNLYKEKQYVINLNGQWYAFDGNPFNNYIYLFHKSVWSNAPTISLPNITTQNIFATQIVPHPTTNIPILLVFYTPGVPAIGYEISPAAYTAYKFKPELINKFNTSKYQNLLTNYPNLPITPLIINSF